MAKKKKDTTLARTPIIAVMGHVDHGKTSILDVIRNTNVQGGEEGGITQNTRAHQIEHNGQKITFIDTPGHEAFSEMRSRGARVTDIVLLVVAADDGVQPQTLESIKFAKEAKVPMMVAINKMDLPGANPDKVKQELSQHDVLVEQFGGDVMTVEVSAVKKTGIDELLESILLQAEILELKKNKVAQGLAEAFVLESTLHEAKGPLSLILLKAGEIKVGDYVVYQGGCDKIRAIMDENFRSMENAQEGDPVWLIGVSDTLPTGEVLLFESDLKSGKALSDKFAEEPTEEIAMIEEVKEKSDEEGDDEDSNLALLAELLGEQQEEDDIKYLNIVLKTDTQGTLEAVAQKLNSLGDDEVKVNILSSGTGIITEKDILTAKNSKGIVVGFQTQLPADAELVAKRERVLVRNYSIIYKLLEEVEVVLDSMLEPEEEIVEVARAEVRQVFELTNGDKVAGSRVEKGNVIRGYKCFVMRGDEEIGSGKIVSLKQKKDDVKEIKKGQECGIIIEPAIDVEAGDIIICYKLERA